MWWLKKFPSLFLQSVLKAMLIIKLLLIHMLLDSFVFQSNSDVLSSVLSFSYAIAEIFFEFFTEILLKFIQSFSCMNF